MRAAGAGALSFALALALAGAISHPVRLGWWEEILRIGVFLLLVRGGRAGARAGFVHGVGELWAWLLYAPLPWSAWFLAERTAAVLLHAGIGATEGELLARRRALPLAALPPLHAALNAAAMRFLA